MHIHKSILAVGREQVSDDGWMGGGKKKCKKFDAIIVKWNLRRGVVVHGK